MFVKESRAPKNIDRAPRLVIRRGIGSSAITNSKGKIYIYRMYRVDVCIVEFVEYFNNTINEHTHKRAAPLWGSSSSSSEREKQLAWKDDI